jgi:hypothetical protein
LCFRLRLAQTAPMYGSRVKQMLGGRRFRGAKGENLHKYLLSIYIIHVMLLILHEIESAYEKEWEILHLPGNISFFLLLHIPLILLMFLGVVTIQQNTIIGKVIGTIVGFGGFIPFLVHKVLIIKIASFNRVLSNCIIYSNIATSVLLLLTLNL